MSGLKRIITIKVYTVLIILLPFTFLSAQYHGEKGMESLRGLKGLAVEFADIDSTLKMVGLNKAHLELDVVLKLKKSGIILLLDRAWSETPGQPLLFIIINSIKLEHLDYYFYSITIDFNQEIIMTRDPTMKVGGRTWGTSMIGFAEVSVIREYIRESLNDLIDLFINDYLAVN